MSYRQTFNKDDSFKTEGLKAEPVVSQSLNEFLKSHVPADYFIDGIMRRGWLYACTAPGTTGKTALGALITKLITQTRKAGQPVHFGSHEVEHGKVAYFAGENPDDLRERFIADLDLSPIEIPDDAVMFFPILFNIETAYDQIKEALEKMGGADFIVVDTSAAWFSKFGTEENDNVEGGNWARVLRSLTRLPGKPTVFVLCHPTKYVTEPALLMPRGGSAFFLELDGNMTLWKDRESGLLTLSQNRWRGVEFEPMTLRTEVITSSKVKTAKGIVMPTIRMVVVTAHEEEITKKAGRADSDTLLVVMLDHPGLSIADLGLRCGGWNKSKAQRVLAGLKSQGLADKRNDDWALTKKGKAIAKEVDDARKSY